MRLVTLWLVASAEAFRVQGASTTHGAKGVQGGGSTTHAKRGGQSTKEVNKKATGSPEVCSIGDSPATCGELTAKFRGGGERVWQCPVCVRPLAPDTSVINLFHKKTR